jgi:isopentenyl-diphosphate delta-isomerase
LTTQKPNDCRWRHSSEVVSFNDEPLVLVNQFDQEIGFLDKESAHLGQGVLHRAFSLLVFNQRGELLLQQRAAGKRLWPGYWSNTCCSHPRRGESLEVAIERRLAEELGMKCTAQFMFKFKYQAQFDAQGAEHELCWVYAGRSDDAPVLNLNEVAALRYVSPQALDLEIAEQPQLFTPWFKTEWERLRREHSALFEVIS